MKKYLFSLLALAAAVDASASTYECSNASGTLTKKAESYSGGPRPYPGVITFREEWKFQGRTLSLIEDRAGQERIAKEDVTVRAVSSRTVLEDLRDPQTRMGTLIYAQKFEITRNDGQLIIVTEGHPGVPRLQELMICEQNEFALP